MPKQPIESETEKLTVNLSVVDLGQIDLLVEEGFYSSRTDLIRTAVRRQLSGHADDIKGTMVRRMLVAGIVRFSRKYLEEQRKERKRMDVKVVGMLSIAKDVTPELAKATIGSVEVRGVLRAPKSVKDALRDRTS